MLSSVYRRICMKAWRRSNLVDFGTVYCSSLELCSIRMQRCFSNQTDRKEIKLEDDPLKHEDFFNVRQLYDIKTLFQNNVHLGHKTGVWNPLMKPYLYADRHGTHIINLNETDRHLFLALNVISHVTYRKGIILFVVARPQFQHMVQKTARSCREYFVIRQWRGGTLTNSNHLLGSVRLPDLIIFLSVPYNMAAIREAAQANIPSIGIVDSDCNPSLLTYPIPGNDDSQSSMQLFCDLFSTAIINAKKVLQAENSPILPGEQQDDTVGKSSTVQKSTAQI